MDAADAQLGEALVIMFTVTSSGLLLLVIIGTGILRTRRIVSALLCSVLAALRAWGLIRIKRLYFLLQRNGRSDQMFSLMQIHLFEIVSSLMLLLVLPFHMSCRANLQGMLWMVMERLRPLATPSELMLFLVGLAITGYGAMGVFFHGDLGVYFIAIGLVVVIAGVRSHHDRLGHMAGVSLIIYILVLLVVTYTAGDW